jgi:hypothetical protein
MASPTGYDRPSSKISFIDVIHHQGHPPCGPLYRRILGKFCEALDTLRDVTINAVQTYGRCKHSHRAHKFVDGNSLKDGYVFEDFFRHLGFWFLRRLARHHCSNYEASNEYSGGAQDRSARSKSHDFLLFLYMEDYETNGGQYTL